MTSAYFVNVVFPPGTNAAYGDGVDFGWIRRFDGADALNRAVAAVPPENRDAEANDRFGKATPVDFLPAPDGGFRRAPGINKRITLWDTPSTDGEEEEREVQTFDFREISRTVTTRRVENPDDPEQYVDVEDTLQITFEGPDGNYWRYSYEAQG